MPALTGQDEVDFSEFYQANYRSVFLATWALAGDEGRAHEVTQEAFTRLVCRWHTVSRYDNPQAWIRTVAVRLAINHRRRLRTQREVAADAQALTLVGDQAVDIPTVADSRIDVALQRLPPSQRTVIVLHYLLDLPLTEISQLTATPINTVKTRLFRARAALADTLRLDREPEHEQPR